MNTQFVQIISRELSVKPNQVSAVLNLFEEGATVPFIARYRKEATGSLDEVVIMNIRQRNLQLTELEQRRGSILKSIEEQGLLTPALKDQILQAVSLSKLEDLYLPYKPKRRTRATIAKEKGLEPLAKMIMSQNTMDVDAKANEFIDKEKEVHNSEEALLGARDIIAEWISENPSARENIRNLFSKRGIIQTKVVKKKASEAAKFKDYFDWSEPLQRAPSHRILAMLRGENEGFLKFKISPDQDEAIDRLKRKFVKAGNGSSQQVSLAAEDSYKRLIGPSIENEVRAEAKKRADKEAIDVFGQNLRELLMAAPLGQKNMLAIDPGFRTGCKVVCLDKQGKLLENTAIFPHPPQSKTTQAKDVISQLIKKHKIEAVAIGNGTAGRESLAFIQEMELPSHVEIVMVNESGASIYSASDVAREEFPNQDITVRGAVSIGRRLMDPLAELVKIDAKSIGVGQYQHDVDQSALKQNLDEVVMSCVNAVGVEVNTASKELLAYVSGLGPQLAGNIVKYRSENGPFKSRKQLMKVARMGAKAFEQAAGFLRIRNAKNPLDASAVHPESYALVDRMVKDKGVPLESLMQDEKERKQIDLQKYVTPTVGLPTLKDILTELDKPGRDPREQFESFEFAKGINELKDLREGMELNGIITNVTKFGAFVDVGVHQEGLVHISEMADRFISDPSDIVKVQQKVRVKVMSIDFDRKRVALSMKGLN